MVTTNQSRGQLIVDLNIPTMAAIIGIVSSLFGGGLWLGTQYAESNSKISKAEMQTTLSQLQTKLTNTENSLEQLKISNAQLKNSEQKLQEDVIQKGLLIVNLNTQANRANNCEFLHAQIKAAQNEIKANGFGVWEAGQTLKNKISDDTVALERRITAYTQQLSTCSK